MNDFELLVNEMRNAQRIYFAKRKMYWLQKSKELEKQVDQHLFNIDNPQFNFDEKNNDNNRN